MKKITLSNIFNVFFVIVIISCGLIIDHYKSQYKVWYKEAYTLSALNVKLEAELKTTKAAYSTLKSDMDKANIILDGIPEIKPYKPKLELAEWQNKQCLAIAVFAEEHSKYSTIEDKEWVAWSMIARAEDPRNDYIYRSSVCGVVAAKYKGEYQYSGMPPYIVDIENVVWGNVKEFTPALAKKSSDYAKQWQEALKVSSDIIDGKLTRKTKATHYISPRGMKNNKFPNWVKDLKPTGARGLHVFFIDYENVDGKRRVFTKENPYRKH